MWSVSRVSFDLGRRIIFDSVLCKCFANLDMHRGEGGGLAPPVEHHLTHQMQVACVGVVFRAHGGAGTLTELEFRFAKVVLALPVMLSKRRRTCVS